MKILHVNNFAYPDYMSDLTFHGGRSLFGEDYESSSPANYMYEAYQPKKHTLYGRGFTLYARLPNPQNAQRSPEEIAQRLSDKFYDCIVYGSIFRCRDLIDLALKTYPRNRIISLDGEDHQGIYHQYANRTTYFKRELSQNTPDVHPTGFGVPKEIFKINPFKKKQFGTVIPGEAHTYVYEREHEYYADYGASYFAITQRKAGWDCLRHYEIIASFCLPRFVGLHECPPTTMVHFPKQLVSEYYRKHKCELHREYPEILNQVYFHAQNHCTTEAIVKNILEKI